jgi:hypothetical protein
VSPMPSRIEVGQRVKLRTHPSSSMGGMAIEARVYGFFISGRRWCVLLLLEDRAFRDVGCICADNQHHRTLYVEALTACMVT